MSPTVHRIWIVSLFTLGIVTTSWYGYQGFRYFITPQSEIDVLEADLDSKMSEIDVELEMRAQGLSSSEKSEAELLAEKERLGAQLRYWLDWQAGGPVGHGLGVIGSLMMTIGVAMYSTRKRMRRLRFAGKIRHWLEAHIFLCLLGPALVLFHTTFKFGGLVSIAAWSMIFVALSGLLGRYVYTQIPRTIEGNERGMDELAAEDEALREELQNTYGLDAATMTWIDGLNTIRRSDTGVLRALLAVLKDDSTRWLRTRALRAHLRERGVEHDRAAAIMRVARKRSLLERRIAFLDSAREIFHYWHVVHLPFAIIMFVILAIHVGVTVSLGYKWIF